MTDWLQQFLRRLFSMFQRSQQDSELDAELSSHLELAIEDNVQRGMPAKEARRQALIQLGGMEQAREHHREARGFLALDTFIQDVRYATRGIRKSPAFATAAVLTLALGIAVNATMFSMVSGFLLRRPPGREPQRVAVITSINPKATFFPDAYSMSAPNYLALRSSSDVFADLSGADEFRTVNLTWQGQTKAIRSAAVSPNHFAVFGVSAELGRTFFTGDDQPGHDHVVILSHEIWDQQFGSDPAIVGSSIRINREDYTVIGVMPASFRLMGFTPQVWTPLVIRAADRTAAARTDRSLYLFARMRPGVTLEQVRAELHTIAHRTEQDFPETEKGWGITARTLPDFLVYAFGVRSGLAVMMTAVGLVLLIACANVAGLLLARAGGRRKEMAIRMSLGAGRLRIIRQLLTEGLLLSSLGSAIGVLLSYWGIRFVGTNLAFNEAIKAIPIGLDRNVLFFALAVCLLSAVLCSLAPALTAARTDINSNLKDESRAASAGRSRSRLRTVLVTCEITLAMFLLIGTGLLIHELLRIQHQNLGFQTDHLLTASVALDSARYKDSSEQAQFVHNLLPRLQQIPGAEAVAVASDLPASGPLMVTLSIKGQPESPANQRPNAQDVVISTDYFRAAGIPLLRGRTFTETDKAGTPHAVVVNEEFVHRVFHDEDPLGKQIRLDVSGATPVWSEIIGIVANVKTYSESSRDDPEVYEPFFQRPVSSFALMIRANSDPNSLASTLHKVVAQEDAELPLARVMSMSAVIENQRGGDPFFLKLMGSFGLLALLLACIGIYGLIAYSVGQRTHEIAIRMALGAAGRDVRRMVLRGGLKMTGIGAAIGFILALPLPKIFDAMFTDLYVANPTTYVVVTILVITVALLASYIPARRASLIDPMRALHSE